MNVYEAFEKQKDSKDDESYRKAGEILSDLAYLWPQAFVVAKGVIASESDQKKLEQALYDYAGEHGFEQAVIIAVKLEFFFIDETTNDVYGIIRAVMAMANEAGEWPEEIVDLSGITG